MQRRPQPSRLMFDVPTLGRLGSLTGSVNFLYQDGQTSVVFTFDGTVQGLIATLTPTQVPQDGAASQPMGTVPTAISASLDAKRSP